MARVEKSVLIMRTPEQMFELVDHVESYPLFLPWCGGTEVLERSPGKTVARLHIRYGGITSHFTTENTNDPPHSMQLALREGPFRRLDGLWRFTPLGKAGCKVEFHLHYDFSSKLIEKVLGPVFGHIVNTFVDSFVKRAEQTHD